MTTNNFNLQRIRVEQESSFGTEMTIGNFKQVPFIEGTATVDLVRPMQSPGHAQQYIDGYSEEEPLPKRAVLRMSLPLATLDTKGTDGVTMAQSALGEILKVVMGGELLGVGTTVNDASPSTTLNTLTSGTGFSEGGAIGYATGTGSALECREIKTKSTNDITVKHALSAAPSNGGTAWAAATYYLTGQIGSEVGSLQFAVEGVYNSDRWLLKGCQATSMSISTPNGGLPQLNFEFQCATWLRADGSSTTMNLTSSDLAAATYTNTKSIVLVDSEFRVGTVGTASISGTLFQPSEITFEPKFSYVPQIAPGGTNNIVQWVRVHQPPVLTGSFTIPLESTTFQTSRDNKTNHSLWLQIGTSTTDGAAVLSAPQIQITDVQQVNAGGIASERVMWKARHDSDFSGSTSTLARSAFRIHLF